MLPPILRSYSALKYGSGSNEQIIQVLWTFPSIQKDLFYVGFSIPANKNTKWCKVMTPLLIHIISVEHFAIIFHETKLL